MKCTHTAIIGAGALGAIYGSLFYRFDPASVCFIASGERYKRLQCNGVTVNDKQFPIAVVRPVAAAPADLLIVAVKHYQLDQAISEIEKVVGSQTTILSVMNGIDSEERIGAVYGMDKLVYGLTLGIDAVRQQNRIHYDNLGRILFGEKQNTTLTERVKRIQNVFTKAGIVHETPVDMIYSLWFKYMINVGVNQVSAVLGASYGDIRVSSEACELMDAAMREVISIARELQVDLSEQALDDWYTVLGKLGSSGKTSMLQDVEAGRKTEVEMLAGTVIKLGKYHGIPTPVNQSLFDELKQIEEKHMLNIP